MFTNQNNHLERSVKASYLVAKLIADRKKHFTDGEFVKECLMEIVETVCPEKILLKFKKIRRVYTSSGRNHYDVICGR